MTSPGVDVLPHAVVSQKVAPGVQAPLLLAAQLRKAGSDVACNLKPEQENDDKKDENTYQLIIEQIRRMNS